MQRVKRVWSAVNLAWTAAPAEQTAADLRYAVRLLWHIHRILENIDLLEPDPFAVEIALRMARLAPDYLPRERAAVAAEIADRAVRGRKLLERG